MLIKSYVCFVIVYFMDFFVINWLLWYLWVICFILKGMRVFKCLCYIVVILFDKEVLIKYFRLCYFIYDKYKNLCFSYGWFICWIIGVIGKSFLLKLLRLRKKFWNFKFFYLCWCKVGEERIFLIVFEKYVYLDVDLIDIFFVVV